MLAPAVVFAARERPHARLMKRSAPKLSVVSPAQSGPSAVAGTTHESAPSSGATNAELLAELEQRMGTAHARLRLGIEQEHEAWIFGQGLNFVHIENWYSGHSLLRKALKASGLYWVGHRNAGRVQVREHLISDSGIPREFDGYKILQISDLHVESSENAIAQTKMLVENLSFDICVLTGDYRAPTYGPHRAAVDGLRSLCSHVKAPVYAVLGNHDTILMVPELERAGITVLLNESVAIRRDGSDAQISLAGVDDAHYFRADNLEKAAADIPADSFSILLSHTPEIYRNAAHFGFNVMLSGHTHGGQICLPGGFPLKLNAVIPRRLGAGPWRHRRLKGYTATGVGTSIVAARFNCPPEVTIHKLEAVDTADQ